MSALAKSLISEDVALLVEAGFLDSELDITTCCQDEIDAIQFASYKDKLVEIAKARLAEQNKQA